MVANPTPDNPDGEQAERQRRQELARRLFSEGQDIFVQPGARSKRAMVTFENAETPDRQDIFFEESYRSLRAKIDAQGRFDGGRDDQEP